MTVNADWNNVKDKKPPMLEERGNELDRIIGLLVTRKFTLSDKQKNTQCVHISTDYAMWDAVKMVWTILPSLEKIPFEGKENSNERSNVRTEITAWAFFPKPFTTLEDENDRSTTITIQSAK